MTTDRRDAVQRTRPGDVFRDDRGVWHEVVEVEPAESYIGRKCDGRFYRQRHARERSALVSRVSRHRGSGGEA